MSLFLKYRPQTFSDVVGQETVRKTLQNALKSENPSHAYLFAGSRGTGKTSTARIFAKALNCENLSGTGDPCDKCPNCLATLEGSLVDLVEIDAASNRGIDEIRELREKISYLPSVAKRKVYIIDEVHMLTKEAFNALLKTLEEPPDHAYFCLATTELHKLPETIISRCQTFLFSRFSIPQITDRLAYISEKENFSVEKEALEIIAKKAEGGMRDAISLLEQVAAETNKNITTQGVQEALGIVGQELLENFFEALRNQNTESGLQVIKNLTHNGQDIRNFGHDFLGFLREKMKEAVKEDPDQLPQILHTIEKIEKALTQLKTAPIIELPLEIAVIEITQNIADVGVIHELPLQKNPTKINTQNNTPQKKAEGPKNQSKPLPQGEISSGERGQEDLITFHEPDPKTQKTKINPVEEQQVGTQEIAPPQGEIGNLPAPEKIQRKLEEIAQKSGISIFAKRSFLTCKANIENGKIIFQTDSEFHREKLTPLAIRSAIQKAVQAIFQTNAPIDFIKKDIPKATPKEQKMPTLPNGAPATVDDFLAF